MVYDDRSTCATLFKLRIKSSVMVDVVSVVQLTFLSSISNNKKLTK